MGEIIKKSRPIDGQTGLVCLLGQPVAHSLSPAMHNTAFDALGLNFRYLAFDVCPEDLASVSEGLKKMGAVGWNLTMPHKTEMAKLVDELSPAAKLIGAVNTVVNDGGKLTGHITDGVGEMRNLKAHGADVKGQRIVMAGAGGAARAVAVQAALDGAVSIDIFNRSEDKAHALAELIGGGTDCAARGFALSDRKAFGDALADADIFINGTLLGMAPDTDSCVLEDGAMLSEKTVVADLVYHPGETKLLRMAKARGCDVVPGFGMLLYQGAAAFELWTGEKMPVETVKEKVFDAT